MKNGGSRCNAVLCYQLRGKKRKSSFTVCFLCKVITITIRMHAVAKHWRLSTLDDSPPTACDTIQHDTKSNKFGMGPKARVSGKTTYDSNTTWSVLDER